MSKIVLDPVYRLEEPVVTQDTMNFLFDLLRERDAVTNISHQRMPSHPEHVEFVLSRPYREWWIVWDAAEPKRVGALYLSKNNEIGVFLLKKHRGQGFGPLALAELLNRYRGEPLYANINPENQPSIHLFTELGFRHIQNTYRLAPQIEASAA